jgi:hypothetical protein
MSIFKDGKMIVSETYEIGLEGDGWDLAKASAETWHKARQLVELETLFGATMKFERADGSAKPGG